MLQNLGGFQGWNVQPSSPYFIICKYISLSVCSMGSLCVFKAIYHFSDESSLLFSEIAGVQTLFALEVLIVCLVMHWWTCVCPFQMTTTNWFLLQLSVELALRLKLSFRKKIACLSQFVLSCTFYIRSSLCFDCWGLKVFVLFPQFCVLFFHFIAMPLV